MLERGASVTGIDHSAASVARSVSKVGGYMERGKASVDCGSVQSLPYAAGSFDLVTAFEVIYFWSDTEGAFKEVLRVLRPGGRFVVAMGAWKEDGGAIHCPKIFQQNLEMTLYSSKDLELLMSNAGFSSSEAMKGRKANWIAVSGRKDG